MERKATRLRIVGRVQGVGYRWWAERTAKGLGLSGWVRNCADGSVELLAIGAPPALEELVAACHEGPVGATVREVETLAAADDGSVGFETRR